MNKVFKEFDKFQTSVKNCTNVIRQEEGYFFCISAVSDDLQKVKSIGSLHCSKSFIKESFLRHCEKEKLIKDIIIEIGLEMYLQDDKTGEKLTELINHINKTDDN